MSEVITNDFWKISMKEMEDMKGWNLEWNDKKIQCFSKKLYENTDMNTIKCFTTIHYPVDLLYKVVLDGDTRVKWAPNVVKSKIIEKGDDWDIHYMLNQPPFSMISQREMLVVRKFKKVENGYDVVVKSTTHKDYEIKSDVIRAEVLAQNIKIRKSLKNDQHSDVTLLNQINCGWIPRWVMGQIMKNMPNIVIDSFSKGCEYHLSQKSDL
eukprot:gene7295-11614_t